MRRYHLSILSIAAAIAASLAGCRAPQPYHGGGAYAPQPVYQDTANQDRGTLIGGLAGAGIGAAIGENNDNPLAGAAIGAAVGALSGAALGNVADREEAAYRAQVEQRIGRRLAESANIADVIAMSQAGVSDQIIIQHVRTNGVAQRLTASDIIHLNQSGVSEPVITAMSEASVGPRVAAQPVAAPRTVYVEEHHYVPPARYRYCAPPPAYYRTYHHHHHHRPQPAVGFSFRGKL